MIHSFLQKIVSDSSNTFVAYKKTKVDGNPLFYFDIVQSGTNRLYFHIRQENWSGPQSVFYYSTSGVVSLNGYTVTNVNTTNIGSQTLIQDWSFVKNPLLSDFGACSPIPTPTPILEPTPTPTPIPSSTPTPTPTPHFPSEYPSLDSFTSDPTLGEIMDTFTSEELETEIEDSDFQSGSATGTYNTVVNGTGLIQTYKNGLIHGFYREYVSGILVRRMVYENGLNRGISRQYFENTGKIKIIQVWNQDALVGEVVFNEDGSILRDDLFLTPTPSPVLVKFPRPSVNEFRGGTSSSISFNLSNIHSLATDITIQIAMDSEFVHLAYVQTYNADTLPSFETIKTQGYFVVSSGLAPNNQYNARFKISAPDTNIVESDWSNINTGSTTS